jgi:mRNA-degrading endonuclease RelE of RelBE toxin-antitoxin system
MTAWAVSVTDTFLNELLNLPHSISKKVAGKIKILEKDPISAQGDAKKLKGYKPNIYRVRLGDYRLFYSFGEDWVKLLSVRKRDDRTYETEVPAFDIPVAFPPADGNWESSTPEISNETSPPLISRSLPFTLTEEQLQQWQIPQSYWHDLCQIQTENDLITLPLPAKNVFDRQVRRSQYPYIVAT